MRLFSTEVIYNARPKPSDTGTTQLNTDAAKYQYKSSQLHSMLIKIISTRVSHYPVHLYASVAGNLRSASPSTLLASLQSVGSLRTRAIHLATVGVAAL